MFFGRLARGEILSIKQGVHRGRLTFLGLGVQPDLPSWGNMLAGSRGYLNVAWWMSVFPGLAPTLTVLTMGGPGATTEFLSLYLYKIAFKSAT